jgi:hypothetical protein
MWNAQLSIAHVVEPPERQEVRRLPPPVSFYCLGASDASSATSFTPSAPFTMLWGPQNTADQLRNTRK